MTDLNEKNRGSWCLGHELFIPYYDEEWGVPVHDDRRLFEMLILEGAQAGLSWKNLKEIPAKTAESDGMSKDLQKRGFKFVGSTICYAFMQAVGMVNDHTVDCWKRR